MKTLRYFLIFCFAIVSLYSQTQSIDPSSVWRVNSSIWDVNIRYNYFFKDFIEGDTSLNSIQYFKIYKSGYVYVDWIPYPFYSYFEHEFHGYLREENHKWYTFENGRDTLLYDFTLSVNDTVYSAYTDFIYHPLIVTSIDSVLINNEYEKRFQLNNEVGEGTQYIIEDIGASSGLFENMVFFEWESELVCFALDGVSVWGETTEDCDLSVGIKDNNFPEGQFTVFPNPSTGIFWLKCPSQFDIQQLEVYTANGRIIPTSFSRGNHFTDIDLGSVQPGIYFLRVISDEEVRFLKLIRE